MYTLLIIKIKYTFKIIFLKSMKFEKKQLLFELLMKQLGKRNSRKNKNEFFGS